MLTCNQSKRKSIQSFVTIRRKHLTRLSVGGFCIPEMYATKEHIVRNILVYYIFNFGPSFRHTW